MTEKISGKAKRLAQILREGKKLQKARANYEMVYTLPPAVYGKDVAPSGVPARFL